MSSIFSSVHFSVIQIISPEVTRRRKTRGVGTRILVTSLVFLSGCMGFPSSLSREDIELSFCIESIVFSAPLWLQVPLNTHPTSLWGHPYFPSFGDSMSWVTSSYSTYTLLPAVSVLTIIQFLGRGNCVYVVFFKYTLFLRLLCHFNYQYKT